MFIKKFGAIGACYATIIAEILVMLIQTNIARKYLDIGRFFKDSIPFLLNSIIMFFIINIFKYADIKSIVRIILQILSGGMIYFILNIKYILKLIKIDKFLKKKNV